MVWAGMVQGIISGINQKDITKEQLKYKEQSEKNELYKNLLEKDNTNKIVLITSVVFFFVIASLIIYFYYKNKSK